MFDGDLNEGNANDPGVRTLRQRRRIFEKPNAGRELRIVVYAVVAIIIAT